MSLSPCSLSCSLHASFPTGPSAGDPSARNEAELAQKIQDTEEEAAAIKAFPVGHQERSRLPALESITAALRQERLLLLQQQGAGRGGAGRVIQPLYLLMRSQLLQQGCWLGALTRQPHWSDGRRSDTWRSTLSTLSA